MFTTLFFIIFEITGAVSIDTTISCDRCPDLENLKGSRIDPSCKCAEDYFDPTTDKCVKYFDCPFFDFLEESNMKDNMVLMKGIGLNVEFSKYVHKVVDCIKNENLKEGKEKFYDVVTSEFPLEAILNIFGGKFNATTVKSSPDMVLIKEIFNEKLEALSDDYYERLSSYFNPFVMANKKINDVCKENRACVWYEVFERNSLNFQKQIAELFRDVSDEIVVLLDEVQLKTEPFCNRNECLFLQKFMRYQLFAKEFLQNFKRNSSSFAKKIVVKIKNSREGAIETINEFVIEN